MLLKKTDTKLWLYYLVEAYSLVNKTGLLRSGFARSLFENLYFFYKNLAKDPLKTLVKHHPALLRNGHILDIGSNIGYTVAVLESAIDSDFKIFAFEPDKTNFKSLSARYEKKDRISCQQLAVGSRNEEITLWHNKDSHADHRILTSELSSLLGSGDTATSYKVSCVNIDSFLEKHSIQPQDISFIKIDVQGFEINVIKGMTNTLRNNPNISIMIEFDKNALIDLGFDPKELLNLIAEHEFSLAQISSTGAITPVTQEDLLSERYSCHTDLILRKNQ